MHKSQEALRFANHLFNSSEKIDWVTFYREVLGVDGIVRRLYPDQAALAEFEATEEYAEIQKLLTTIREKTKNKSKAEPIRVITVRMPKSLHEALNVEAMELKTSVNQLCISKLIQWIDGEFVPSAPEEDRPQIAEAPAMAIAGSVPVAAHWEG
ncbi:MAG: toxin-antitoxin system HicB family antitoxin [Pirellulales bacterium]|nr:toxin-antitoxin system HicB family antitoxin [Pirellulales bacterium]